MTGVNREIYRELIQEALIQNSSQLIDYNDGEDASVNIDGIVKVVMDVLDKHDLTYDSVLESRIHDEPDIYDVPSLSDAEFL